MPDRRSHRGPHPTDSELFAQSEIEKLSKAVEDFSLLLTKGYAETSALKLVGDRFALVERQRVAVKRCSCSDQQLKKRKNNLITFLETTNRPVIIDGYNVLITIEAALSNAVIFKGRDGCYKDLASIHGTYKKVDETIPAIEIIGGFLNKAKISQAVWLLDSPISNSGRLKTLIGKLADKNNWNWDVKLLTNPDEELKKTDLIAASSDGVVLDECKNWINLAAEIIKNELPATRVVDLSGDVCRP